MHELLQYLHDESKVQGVTVFRGITGFGSSGEVHSSTLIDMSLDLPIVIEFSDTAEKVVNAPSNPIISPARHSTLTSILSIINTYIKPINNEPITLTVNVPYGNPLPKMA